MFGFEFQFLPSFNLKVSFFIFLCPLRLSVTLFERDNGEMISFVDWGLHVRVGDAANHNADLIENGVFIGLHAKHCMNTKKFV